MPTNLFRVVNSKNRLCVAPIPDSWHPGDELVVLPPLGYGFHIPETARRIGLLTMGVSPVRLLPLVETAKMQEAVLTLFCDSIPSADVLALVPPQVEITSLGTLKENLDWPDYLAADVKHKDLDRLLNLFGPSHLSFTGEVLVRMRMPCHGVAECGVCSVKTKSGWQLACVDGPVFPLKELRCVA